MSLIACALSVFGILFVVRTLDVFRARGLVRETALNWIGTAALVCFSLVLFLTPGEALARASCAGLIALLMPLALHTLERRRIAAFKARVPLFLDRWILNLRLGGAVTAARDAALREEDVGVRALLGPVFNASPGERRSHLFLSTPVLREFDQISRASHAALERLESLRRCVRDDAEFRRKSGQAVRQAAIQSVVMLVMLVALSVFTVRRYGWNASGGFVTAAGALALIGAALMMQLARKTKWTV